MSSNTVFFTNPFDTDEYGLAAIENLSLLDHRFPMLERLLAKVIVVLRESSISVGCLW